MTAEHVPVSVDSIFQTLSIYDDHGSRKAVDDAIIKALTDDAFMKSFAATLVQAMERHSKFQSLTAGYRLLKWSCILLIHSQFATLSKNGLFKVAQLQALVLQMVMRGSLGVRRACRKTLFHLFTKLPNIYNAYVEAFKDGRIPCKDSPELIYLMLEYANLSPSSFDKVKDVFLDVYVNSVLNAKEKPSKGLSEAFIPLFAHMSHEDFKNTILPSSLKMLKRNPELVLESVGVLLQSVNLDLSKYVTEILPVVSTQARHADEGRRLVALSIVRSLSQKSSSPDAIEAMFNSVKSVLGGSEGRLTFPYQRVGMVNAIREVSDAPEGKYFSSLSPTVCGYLLSCYKDDGNEEVKLAILSCLASWAVKSADAISPDLVTFFVSGLKEKETLRRGYLRCLRLVCRNTDAVMQMSPLLLPLLQLVKTGFTKAAQRLDGIFALFCVVKIASVDVKADETISKEKIWQLILQNEPTIIPISLASKLSVEDLMTCVDLYEVLLVDYSQRLLEIFSTKAFLQPPMELPGRFLVLLIGAKIVFWDMRDSFMSYLYYGGVEGNRLDAVLPQFDKVLNDVCSVIDGAIRDLVVSSIWKATLEGFMWILLDGGPSRAFSDSDAILIEEDFNMLKELFIADGEGLPRSLVEEEAKFYRQVLGLFSLQTGSLVKMLMVSSQQISASLNNKKQGQRYLGDAHTLIRVLCHKKDREASKFLKRHYRFPASSEYDETAVESSSFGSPFVSNMLKHGASFRWSEKSHSSFRSITKKFQDVSWKY